MYLQQTLSNAYGMCMNAAMLYKLPQKLSILIEVNITTKSSEPQVIYERREWLTSTAFQAIVDTSPQTLVLPPFLPIVLALLVLRLLILLASAMPLAMTMRIHIGSLIGPTRVMLSCFTLHGQTQLPCT